MIAKKMRVLFESEWKTQHGGKAWSDSASDHKELNMKMGGGLDSSVERAMAEPIAQWRAHCYVMALPAVGVHRSPHLTHVSDTFQEWIKLTSTFMASIGGTPGAHHYLDAAGVAAAHQEHALHLKPLLVSFGYSSREVDAVLTQTDFSPNPKADAGNEALEKLKAEGNDFFRAKDFSAAIAKYSAALELPNLADDTRAILHSNTAASLLELKRWRLAIAEARLAAALKPAWFKPYFWMYRAHNALFEFEATLDLAGYLPHAFPQDWLPKAEAEMKYALSRFNAPEHPAGYDTSPTPFGSNTAEKAAEARKAGAPSIFRELYDRCNSMVEAAERGLANGSKTALESIALTAKGLIEGRELNLTPLEKVYFESIKRPTHYESMVNIAAYMVMEKAQVALPVFNKILEQWPNDPYFLERKAHFMARHGDFPAAIELLKKAIENYQGKGEPTTLRYFIARFTWTKHLQASFDPKCYFGSNGSKSAPDGTSLGHLPLQERVPSSCFADVIQFVQTSPIDHPEMPNAYYTLSHMYLIEDQIDLARQFFDAAKQNMPHQLPEVSDYINPMIALLEPKLKKRS